MNETFPRLKDVVVRFWRLATAVSPAVYPDPLMRWRAQGLRLLTAVGLLTMPVLLLMQLAPGRSHRVVTGDVIGTLVNVAIGLGLNWIVLLGPRWLPVAAGVLLPGLLLFGASAAAARHGIFDPAALAVLTVPLLGMMLLGGRRGLLLGGLAVLLLVALGLASLRGLAPLARRPLGDVEIMSAAGALMSEVVGLSVLLYQWERLHRRLLGEAEARGRAEQQAEARAQALAELDQVKTDFFNNASHELRTPLAASLGTVEALLGDEALPAPLREPIMLVWRNERRLLKLVNVLLQMASIDAGRARPERAPVDLAALTVDLCAELRSAIEAAGLRLTVDCPPLPAPVAVDPGMWEKIVLNLLGNAFKFTREGEVRVTLRARPGAVELCVRDTGCGIAPEEQGLLFERFRRLRAPWSRSAEGTGIGLALSRELSRLHGGDVRVESAVGRGAAFTVTLPAEGPAAAPPPPAPSEISALVAAPPPPPSEAAAPYVAEARSWAAPAATGATVGEAGTPPRPEAPAPGEAGRVLVVEDAADMRALLVRVLSAHWHVTACGGAEEALQALHRARPDVVVSDVIMNGLDGLALVRALRDDPRVGTVPVILLSARGDEQATVAGLAAGADDYLVKPVSPLELCARVRVHMELVRARREAVQARERFMRMVVHELRTPLTVVKMYAQRGQGRQFSPEVETAFAKIGRGLSRMERLITDLADAARLERRALAMARQRCDLSALCREAADDRAEAASRRVEVELPSAPVIVEADPERIIQVLDNLLGNALKYSPQDQPVRLRLRRAEGQALLEVSDRGPGVAPVDLRRLFDCYYQTGLAGKGQGLGLGLGLFICREIVEGHGGSIRAESAPGQGLRVEVHLPLSS